MLWKAHQRDIRSLVLGPDTSSIISGDIDGYIVQWASRIGEQRTVIRQPQSEAHGEGIHKLAFNPDGSKLAAMRLHRGQLEIYDTQSWQLQCIANNTDVYTNEFYDFSWHPSGKYLAIAAHGIHIVDSQNGARIKTPYLGHDSATYCVAYTPDGTKLVSGGDEYDHSLALWDAKTFHQLAKICSTEDESVEVNLPAYILHITNQDVVIHDGGVLKWTFGTQTLSRAYSFGSTSQLLSAGIDKSGTLLAHESINGEADVPSWQWPSLDRAKVYGATVKVINLASGQTIGSLGGYEDRITSLVFSPDSKQLFTGDGKGYIRVWDV
jgi:WD40 repeat protein